MKREATTPLNREVTPLESPAEVAALFTKKPIKEIITGMHNTLKMMPREKRTYQIYSANSLSALIDVAKQKGQHTIRYMLTAKPTDDQQMKAKFMDPDSDLSGMVDDELLFAEEGNEPAHFVMSGQEKGLSYARCAGNITFNDDFTKIKLINNKSGDYTPDDVLLKRVLGVIGALAQNGLLNLEDQVEIELLRSRQTYSVSADVLKQFAESEFSEAEMNSFVAANLRAQQRTATYTPKQQPQSKLPPQTPKRVRPVRPKFGGSRSMSSVGRGLFQSFQETQPKGDEQERKEEEQDEQLFLSSASLGLPKPAFSLFSTVATTTSAAHHSDEERFDLFKVPSEPTAVAEKRLKRRKLLASPQSKQDKDRGTTEGQDESLVVSQTFQ